MRTDFHKAAKQILLPLLSSLWNTVRHKLHVNLWRSTENTETGEIYTFFVDRDVKLSRSNRTALRAWHFNFANNKSFRSSVKNAVLLDNLLFYYAFIYPTFAAIKFFFITLLNYILPIMWNAY